VQSRLERLERRGVIAGYGVRLSDEHEKGLVKAHVLITAGPKAAPKVRRSCARFRKSRTLHSVSGIST
jgi:DNA-binding Lrp family transcriptional regulator